MECGHLERHAVEGRPMAFMGEIALAGVLSGEVCLIERSKRSDKSPDYAVKFRPYGAETWAEMGLAWQKKLKAGGVMFSVTIDGPTMQAPVYVSAFPLDEQPKGTAKGAPCLFRIDWSRPRRKAGGPEVAVPVGNDEIPY